MDSLGVPHPGRTQLGPQVHSPHSAPRQPRPGAGGSFWPPTFPTVGFSLRAPPTPVLLSPACSARLPGWPALPLPPALGTHTAWPGGPGPLEHPVSRPMRPLLCSLPNLLLMALCPLTPPVPAHSVFTEIPLPHPAWSVSPLLPAPVTQQDRSPGTAGHSALGCSFPATASELPHGSWAAASPPSPVPVPSWADQGLVPLSGCVWPGSLLPRRSTGPPGFSS